MGQMVGLVIAVILGIFAFMATAATAGLALHKEIQIAEFIREWHKQSKELWTEQNKINNEKMNQLS